jgi:hypothetical protein
MTIYPKPVRLFNFQFSLAQFQNLLASVFGSVGFHEDCIHCTRRLEVCKLFSCLCKSIVHVFRKANSMSVFNYKHRPDVILLAYVHALLLVVHSSPRWGVFTHNSNLPLDKPYCFIDTTWNYSFNIMTNKFTCQYSLHDNNIIKTQAMYFCKQYYHLSVIVR